MKNVERKFKKGDIVKLTERAKKITIIGIEDKEYLNEQFVITRMCNNNTMYVKRRNNKFINSDSKKVKTCLYVAEFFENCNNYKNNLNNKINYEFLKTK